MDELTQEQKDIMATAATLAHNQSLRERLEKIEQLTLEIKMETLKKTAELNRLIAEVEEEVLERGETFKHNGVTVTFRSAHERESFDSSSARKWLNENTEGGDSVFMKKAKVKARATVKVKV